SDLVPLDPPYSNLLGTSHGKPFVDPTTRVMGFGTEPNTWAYLGTPNIVQASAPFYDPQNGSVYQTGVYGTGVADRAYVVGVVYKQGFANSVPDNPPFSYFDPKSTPVAGATVQLTAYYKDNTGTCVQFSQETTTTWSGGGYQFQVQR